MVEAFKEMSDFEINCKVALYLGKHPSSEHECLKTGACYLLTEDLGVREEFNPCNNPSDAWPIIQLIWVTLMSPPYRGYGTLWDNIVMKHNCGKLRAAMACFLELKQAQNA